MKTVRRPPYPKWNPGYFPCSSLTPPSAFLTPSIGVLRWIRAKALGLGHGAGAPVGCSGGFGLGSGLHHLVHPVGSVGHPPAPAGCDLGEGTRAALEETLAPEHDGGTTDAHLSGNPAIGHTVGGEEGDPGPEGDALGSVLGTDPGFQRSALLGRYREEIS